MSSSTECRIRRDDHITTLMQRITQKMEQGQHVDVTLACGDGSIKCHRLVLAASSPYLEKIILEQPAENLVIFVTDMEFWVLEALVAFMYNGKLTVSRQKLIQIVPAAEKLKIRGLAPVTDEHVEAPNQNIVDLATQYHKNSKANRQGLDLTGKQPNFQLQSHSSLQATTKQQENKRKNLELKSPDIEPIKRPRLPNQAYGQAGSTRLILVNPTNLELTPPASTTIGPKLCQPFSGINTQSAGRIQRSAVTAPSKFLSPSIQIPTTKKPASIGNPERCSNLAVGATARTASSTGFPYLSPMEIGAPLVPPAQFEQAARWAIIYKDVRKAADEFGIPFLDLSSYIARRITKTQQAQRNKCLAHNPMNPDTRGPSNQLGKQRE